MWSRSLIPVLTFSSIGLFACASSAQPAKTTPSLRTSQSTTIPAVTSGRVTPSANLSQTERFTLWKNDFINRAVQKGYERGMVSRLISPAVINERAIDRNKKQPEFSKPIWSYVDGAASADRLTKGREKLSEQSQVFEQIETRYQVPRHILTAIWGLETAYGKILGNHDIISALSTFAFEGRRQKFGEEQLFAVLDMLRRGDIRINQLTGSWAGAMGMTQFIPTTFRDYAVDFNGDGNKDLWTNEGDALGSAAHYLSRHGWRYHEPIMTEVSVSPNFNYSYVEAGKKSVAEWSALGVRPISNQNWSNAAMALDAKLIAPGGHKGPKLLTFKNFDVIKKYNNSTSYATGITVLGEALRGKSVLKTPWPRNDKPLSFSNKKSMQTKLNALGFDVGSVDGQIGPNTRKGIRAWQKSQRLPADGYMEQRLYQRLIAQ